MKVEARVLILRVCVVFCVVFVCCKSLESPTLISHHAGNMSGLQNSLKVAV